MKLFRDKASGEYSVLVNKDSGRKHNLETYYPKAGHTEGEEGVDHSQVLDAYRKKLKQFQARIMLYRKTI